MNQRHLVSYQCLSLVRTWLKWADPFINMENIFLSKPLLHFTFECKFTWSSDCLEMIFHVEKLFGQANKLSAVNKMLANLAGIWTNYLWLWTVALGDLDRRKDKRCFHPECINQFRKNKDIPFFLYTSQHDFASDNKRWYHFGNNWTNSIMLMWYMLNHWPSKGIDPCKLSQ